MSGKRKALSPGHFNTKEAGNLKRFLRGEEEHREESAHTLKLQGHHSWVPTHSLVCLRTCCCSLRPRGANSCSGFPSPPLSTPYSLIPFSSWKVTPPHPQLILLSTAHLPLSPLPTYTQGLEHKIQSTLTSCRRLLPLPLLIPGHNKTVLACRLS